MTEPFGGRAAPTADGAAGLRYRRDADEPTTGLPSVDTTLAARAAAILQGPTASVHEHPVRFPDPLTAETWAAHMAVGADVLADAELRRSGLDLVVATCFSQPSLSFVHRWIASMTAQVDAAPGLVAPRPGQPLSVVGAAERSDRSDTAVLLGLEDLGPAETLDDIAELGRLGIVSAGVAYNAGSKLGSGLGQHDTGLTAFGHDAVRLMNEIGMVVDVSHAGARTSLEAIAASTAPVVINHAGAAALWPSPRMVGDDVIRAAAESGGLIGIEAAPGSTRTRPTSGAHDVGDVVRHVEYCAELVGVEAVAIGGDTFYGDHVGLYRALGSAGAALPDGAVPFDGTVVPGADHPGEIVRQVALRLLAAGWADADVAAVVGGNAFRVLGAGRAA